MKHQAGLLNMLIQIKKNNLPSISKLHHIAVDYIFNRASVTMAEQAVLETGIDEYVKLELSKEDKWNLKRIVNALIADEHGYFNRSKELQKQHGIDYRKMYYQGLPMIDAQNRRTWNKS